ncbi:MULTISPECIES: hypothetical protein [unclassified Chelatococcus]|jgi:hypothetical protein|nr:MULTISPECIES: hypothetical protein [unclassified Chelatococcus]
MDVAILIAHVLHTSLTDVEGMPLDKAWRYHEGALKVLKAKAGTR